MENFSSHDDKRQQVIVDSAKSGIGRGFEILEEIKNEQDKANARRVKHDSYVNNMKKDAAHAILLAASFVQEQYVQPLVKEGWLKCMKISGGLNDSLHWDESKDPDVITPNSKLDIIDRIIKNMYPSIRPTTFYYGRTDDVGNYKGNAQIDFNFKANHSDPVTDMELFKENVPDESGYVTVTFQLKSASTLYGEVVWDDERKNDAYIAISIPYQQIKADSEPELINWHQYPDIGIRGNSSIAPYEIFPDRMAFRFMEHKRDEGRLIDFDINDLDKGVLDDVMEQGFKTFLKRETIADPPAFKAHIPS